MLEKIEILNKCWSFDQRILQQHNCFQYW